VNLRRNTEEIREVRLHPWYLRDYAGADLRTEIFGQTYEAPFGVAPIGLQGLVWPRATEILAKATRQHQVPFILSTVATASVETAAEIERTYPSILVGKERCIRHRGRGRHWVTCLAAGG
jgi:L-lactate dehydrogenase (cytochrome)